MQVKTTDPVNPGDLYGVSKCFGEALGRYFAEKEGLSVIALRIGAFQRRETAHAPENVGLVDAFVSRRDLNQLIGRCIDAEQLQFAIFNGLSNNRFKRLDISDARDLLGYEPEDDFAQENPKLARAGVRGDRCWDHTARNETSDRHSARMLRCRIRHGAELGAGASRESGACSARRLGWDAAGFRD